jgi:hypothetical protein
VSLPLPPQVGADTDRKLQSVPIFQDQYKGYLVVQYLGANGGSTKLVVYSTSDTGKSWQPAKVLDQAPGAAGGVFDIVDSMIIVSTGSSAKNVGAATVPLNGGASGIKASDRGIVTLKFADKVNGWMLTADYRLLATQDGGSSWKGITPPSPALRKETVPIPKKGLAMIVTSADTLASGAAASSSTYGSNTHISKHLGFDMSYVRPASPDMQTWWQYSPYYDTYIYLWGALNRGPVDTNLNSGWVTQVKNQGWGVIPIWFGRQAPAGCPLPPGTTFKYYIDTDPRQPQLRGSPRQTPQLARPLHSGCPTQLFIRTSRTTTTQSANAATW